MASALTWNLKGLLANRPDAMPWNAGYWYAQTDSGGDGAGVYRSTGSAWEKIAALVNTADAADVTFDPTGLAHITEANVQGALEEVDAALDAMGGAGAPTAAKYVVGEAHGDLSAEIVIPGLRGARDIVPASPNALDDEFDAASLDVKWTKYNYGTSTENLTDNPSWIKITPQTSNWRGIAQAVSGNFDVTARLSGGFTQRGDGWAGIWIFGSSDGTGDVWEFGKDGTGGVTLVRAEQISSYGFNGTRSNHTHNYGPTHAWLRVKWDGTNLQYFVSTDGMGWVEYTPFAPGYTPAKIGIATRSSQAGAVLYCDWFRKV